jgi:hypothetical protein
MGKQINSARVCMLRLLLMVVMPLMGCFFREDTLYHVQDLQGRTSGRALGLFACSALAMRVLPIVPPSSTLMCLAASHDRRLRSERQIKQGNWSHRGRRVVLIEPEPLIMPRSRSCSSGGRHVQT